MTNQDEKAPKARRSDPSDGAARSGRASIGANPTFDRDSAVPRPQAEVELYMADLVGDANGEIVFFNDSAVRTVGLITDATVVADGHRGRHVTAGGTDVSGLRYVTFDNGLTLYYGSDVELIIRRPAGRAHR